MPSLATTIKLLPYRLLGPVALRKVEFVLPYVRGKDVLDVGVVQHTTAAYDLPSWVHRHVRREAASCLGIDVLEEGIRFLRERGFDVVRADAEAFDLGRTFDTVVACDVVEHLGDVKGFLASARRHLRRGGQLVITTPNPWFFVRRWEALFGEPSENPEHTAWYSIGTLTEALRRGGFTVEHATYGSGEERPWRFLFMPARLRHSSIWLVARATT